MDQPAELADDHVVDLLTDPVPRAVLEACRRHPDRRIDLVALAHAVKDSETIDADDTDELRIRLHHVVLPKLAKANLIEYASTCGHVRVVGAEKVDALMRTIDHRGGEN